MSFKKKFNNFQSNFNFNSNNNSKEKIVIAKLPLQNPKKTLIMIFNKKLNSKKTIISN